MPRLKSLIAKKIFHIFIKAVIGLFCVFLIAGSFIVFEEELIEYKIFLWAKFSKEYTHQKNCVNPYFDEAFYVKQYGNQVKKSGLLPLDHFLQKGWHSHDWRKHTDPNPWFNTTLYQMRLWGKKASFWKKSPHPFVDFLTQSKKIKSKNTIHIYATAAELHRAWLAAEGLLRITNNQIALHLPKNLNKSNKIILFTPQTKRGLRLIFDNTHHKSFYHSDFLKNPDAYRLTKLEKQTQPIEKEPVTYVKEPFSHLMHRLYNYTNWYQVGRINPTMINIAHYCDEPLIFARFENKITNFRKFLNNILHGQWKHPKPSVQDFKDYMVRIAPGFDLCLLNTKLPISNLKIIPGFLRGDVNEKELNKEKSFSVSYLLSLGGASFSGYRKNTQLNYLLRKQIWEHEHKITIPTKFYLSYRDRHKYPKNLQHHALPSDSKKWIFNSQFTIAIENFQQADYFSEKILGPFIALSVPIYMGCPNIGEYFDSKGMIIVQSEAELIKTLNSLTPSTYKKMLPYLKENRRRALILINFERNTLKDFKKNLGLS